MISKKSLIIIIMNFNNLFYNLFLNKNIKYIIISIIKQNKK